MCARNQNTNINGSVGTQGATGAQGPAGAKGDTGAQGPAGAKGDKGDKGDPFNASSGLDLSCNSITDISRVTFCNNIAIDISGGPADPNIVMGHSASVKDATNSIAIGNLAYTGSGNENISIGNRAGHNSANGNSRIYIGRNAGRGGGLNYTGNIAIGHQAGATHAGDFTIAIGHQHNFSQHQHKGAIAIGHDTGTTQSSSQQGEWSIALGGKAGQYDICHNTIIINATGDSLDNAEGTHRLFIKPIRNDISKNVLYYSHDTGEITYGQAGAATGGLDLSCNSIKDVSGIHFCDKKTYIGSGNVKIGPISDISSGELQLMDISGDNYVGFKAPADISKNQIWTLPNIDGSKDQVLKTDGSGALQWDSVSSTTAVNLWYESWHLTDTSPGMTGVNLHNYVYWHGFWVPATGVYHTLRVRVRYQGGPSARLYGNIYESNGDIVNPKPTGSPLGTTAISSFLSQDDQYVTINLGNNIYLTRNKIYYVALKWTGGGGSAYTFYATDFASSEIYHSLAWRSKLAHSPTGLPDPASGATPQETGGIQAAFWFQIFGDQIAPGAATGIKGDTGDKGDIGPAGLSGPQGEKGDTGLAGSPGIQGEQGDTGPAGSSGTQGEQGDKGDTGATGAKGDTGVQGPAGAKGDKGDTGAAGAKGDTGVQGPAGAKGDKGDTGAAGAKGDTGVQGPAGVKGDTGDTGAAGAKGDTGVQGPAGVKGDTGDTGAVGAKGDTGVQGPAGVKGDTGDTGAAGAKGDTGVQGPEGTKGDTGDTGAAGAKGDTGVQGPEGTKGDTGDTGAAGAKGDTGVQGPAGTKGEIREQ